MKEVVKTGSVVRGDQTIQITMYFVQSGSKAWYTVEIKRGTSRKYHKAGLSLEAADSLYRRKVHQINQGDYDARKRR